MPATDPAELCYVVTAEIKAPAAFAFDYLADVSKVGDWALGAFAAKPVGGGAYRGSSIYDGSSVAFSVDADTRRLLIDYLVGDDPKRLTMRISTRVIPGEILGRGKGACLVSMAAWRPKDFDVLRWDRLRAFHDAEIHIVRNRIETVYSASKKRVSAG